MRKKRASWWAFALCLAAGGYLLRHPPCVLAAGEMVLVPAGEFNMGAAPEHLDAIEQMGGSAVKSANATPVHKVDLPAFYIDKYEVTNEEYKKFVEAAGHTPPENWEDNNYPPGKGKHPVVFVTLKDAQAYAEWAGKRLPSEAEWEKAARGTDGFLFPWGDRFKWRYSNTDEANKGGTTAVGSFTKGISPFGAHDMAGNVWEWTSSNYLPYPGSTCKDEFFGNERFVVRGGSWFDGASSAVTVGRAKFTPQSADDTLGFRCAKDAK